MKKIESAYAVYTGGGIWLFHGKLTDGNWFLTDDYGCTVILDKDPSDFDESLYEDWQNEHLIEELEDDKRIAFGDALIEHLRNADSNNRGGISDQELDYYENYFKTI